MLQVILLALLPRKVLLFPLLCTTVHDLMHPWTEPLSDHDRGLSVMIPILHSIMKQGGYRLVFVPAMAEHQAGHRHEMGDIGDRTPLPVLAGMKQRRKALEPL
jgi:hypothetical protein